MGKGSEMTTHDADSTIREDVQEETRTLTTPEGELGLQVRWSEGPGPFPALLFFHRGPGMDDGSRQAMNIFVRAGFLVVAPDRYYRSGAWQWFDPADLRTAGPDSALMTRFNALLAETTDEMVARDVGTVLDALAADARVRPGPMVTVGYCIGARSALRAMAAHPDVFAAGAALHPSFCVVPGPDSPHLVVPALRGVLYVGIGAEDKSSSPEQNRPLIDAVSELGERGVVEVHDGADHGFAVAGPGYHDEAATRSYRSVLSLFEKTFG